jgi:hypothetical protein
VPSLARFKVVKFGKLAYTVLLFDAMVATRRQQAAAKPDNVTDDVRSQVQATSQSGPIKTTEFEFMGPIGTGVMLLGLTGFVFYLCVACNEHQWPDFSWRPSIDEVQAAWDWQAFGVVCGWFLFQAVLYYIAPGRWVKGVKLSDGKQLEYPINGKNSSAG